MFSKREGLELVNTASVNNASGFRLPRGEVMIEATRCYVPRSGLTASRSPPQMKHAQQSLQAPMQVPVGAKQRLTHDIADQCPARRRILVTIRLEVDGNRGGI